MKFERLPKLTDAIAERLNAALGADRAILAEDIASDFAELWECDNGDAYMITRVDHDDLVVCCYEGRNVKHAIPHLIAAAKAKELNAVRFHTKRQSLARLIKDYKPVLCEYVYRINCNGQPVT